MCALRPSANSLLRKEWQLSITLEYDLFEKWSKQSMCDGSKWIGNNFSLLFLMINFKRQTLFQNLSAVLSSTVCSEKTLFYLMTILWACILVRFSVYFVEYGVIVRGSENVRFSEPVCRNILGWVLVGLSFLEVNCLLPISLNISESDILTDMSKMFEIGMILILCTLCYLCI